MADETADTPEKTLLGVAHSDYVKAAVGALLGALLGIIATLFVTWMTSKSPYLRYSPADTVTFQGEKHRFGLVNCVVTNDGSKEAEDVELFVELDQSPFVEIKVTPETLQPVVKWENEPPLSFRVQLPAPAPPPEEIVTVKEPRPGEPLPKKGNRAHVTVKLLNPGESFQVLAMASNPDKLPSRPQFTVRGKGLVGKLGVRPEPVVGGIWLWLAGALLLFPFLHVMMVHLTLRKYVKQIVRSK